MKLLQNGKNCLRIQLTSEDMAHFKIRNEDFDFDTEKTRSVILALCEYAKAETDFSITNDKIYIQLYPKADGGCELFFIRLEEEDGGEYFLFHSFDHLYTACGNLKSQASDCVFYRIGQRDDFLLRIPSEKALPCLWEYGEKLKDAPSRGYLRAKCTRIHPF